MARVPMRFGAPHDITVECTDFDGPAPGQFYERRLTTVWVDEGLEQLVPHQYIAWFWHEGGRRYGALRGFEQPLPPGNPGVEVWDPMEFYMAPDGEVVDPEPEAVPGPSAWMEVDPAGDSDFSDEIVPDPAGDSDFSDEIVPDPAGDSDFSDEIVPLSDPESPPADP